jgi:hypothetical protein
MYGLGALPAPSWIDESSRGTKKAASGVPQASCLRNEPQWPSPCPPAAGNEPRAGSLRYSRRCVHWHVINFAFVVGGAHPTLRLDACCRSGSGQAIHNSELRITNLVGGAHPTRRRHAKHVLSPPGCFSAPRQTLACAAFSRRGPRRSPDCAWHALRIGRPVRRCAIPSDRPHRPPRAATGQFHEPVPRAARHRRGPRASRRGTGYARFDPPHGFSRGTFSCSRQVHYNETPWTIACFVCK